MSGSESSIPKKLTRAQLIWRSIGGLAGLVGILALIQAVTGFTIPGPAPTESPAAATTESPRVETSPRITTESAPVVTSPPAATTPTSSAPSTSPSVPGSQPSAAATSSISVGKSSFIIETKLGEPVIVGRKLGRDAYALGSAGEADITYKWTGYSSSGTKMDGTNCQMVATITGPQTFPTYRTANCSERFASSFNGHLTGLDITVPGTYTISVTDEVTGATASGSFTVSP